MYHNKRILCKFQWMFYGCYFGNNSTSFIQFQKRNKGSVFIQKRELYWSKWSNEQNQSFNFNWIKFRFKKTCRLEPSIIQQLLILACPSVCLTFHVIRVSRRVHVELCEDGLWIYVCGEQWGLYRVMESLFKTSWIELPSIWIPHYLLRK